MHNIIKQRDDDGYSIINKIYLQVKDPSEPKSQHLNENENNGLNDLKCWKAFL